jgi:hypothetical protein
MLVPINRRSKAWQNLLQKFPSHLSSRHFPFPISVYGFPVGQNNEAHVDWVRLAWSSKTRKNTKLIAVNICIMAINNCCCCHCQHHIALPLMAPTSIFAPKVAFGLTWRLSTVTVQIFKDNNDTEILLEGSYYWRAAIVGREPY